MRVIADHLRAMTFLIADGVVPSNEWRGYVLRKIMRRAMRHGKKLGFTEPFLHALVDVVVAEMGDAYPELRRNRDTVVQVVRSEEERFDAVLTAGLPRLEEALDRAAAGLARPAGRRGVPALRLARRAARFHGRHRRPARPVDRSRGLRARDGGPARARARGQLVRDEEGAGVRLRLRRGARGDARARRSVRGLHAHVGHRHPGASRCSTPSGGRRRSSRTARPASSCSSGRRSTSSRADRCPTAASS